MIEANETSAGTANSATPCARQAATRSSGTKPSSPSPASSATAPEEATAATNVSLSSAVRRHIMPVSTSWSRAR